MNKMLSGPDLEFITQQVDTLGFENTFCWNEKFSSINDPKFHELRNKFLLAYCALYNYLGYDTTLIEVKFQMN